MPAGPADTLSSEDLTALIQAVTRLCAARDLSAVVEVVRSTARGLVGADGATFVLREDDVVFYVAEDAIGPLWQGKRFPATSCISGWAMINKQSVAISDIAADSRLPHEVYLPTFARSLAMMPVNREDPIAAIGVYWAGHHAATPRELELLQALADATATALASAELSRGLTSARLDLEHTSTRLRLALSAGAIGTWDYAQRSGELSWDAKCRELYGVSSSDAALELESFFAFMHPDDRERVRQDLAAAYAPGGDGHFDAEYRTLGGRWLAARGRVLFDRHGAPERFVGTLRDISEQKLNDADKAELLRRANEANLAKDEFLALLGHELRNPLAPIVTAVELMKLRGHGAEREVETIERQSQHLTRLVDDLLDIARVTRGKLELKARRVELQAIVTKAIELAAPLIERRRHVLSVDAQPGVWVEGDEFRLAQLLANLLTNAAKYTPDSGNIVIRASALGDEVTLCVRDTGCGISSELLPRLFAPFVQASQSSERSQGGLGLGLALARSLAELHGGTISAESAGAGQGSTFTVRLPIVSTLDERISAPPEPPAQLASTRAIEILVVDDNEDAAELLASALRSHGHVVRVALDPVEALEAMRAALPEVAFMDIGLPVMDGYELAEQLRAELGKRCPVLIAVTGYGQERDRQRSMEAGFALHLVKPVQLTGVLEALGRVAPLLGKRPSVAPRAAE